MSEYTKYLRLIKPGGNDYYNIDDFNQNSELIDKETEKLNNAVTEIKNGATREKAGIVQLGTEEGKALEGMMLARLAGAYGYGGDIQDEGVKNPNYIYYDRNTRKMYKCLKQNQDISANVTNFIPLDNNSLLERLENLNRNYAIIWEGISHDVQFYVTTNSRYNLTFDNIHSLTIIGNTTCTIPSILLKKLPLNKELVLGHDNGVRSDAVFYFKKLSNILGMFGTRGFAEDIHLHGYNTLIVEY
nr:MAG TPA: hypothetical protein [Siphoviridae sp. ct8IY7]